MIIKLLISREEKWCSYTFSDIWIFMGLEKMNGSFKQDAGEIYKRNENISI